MTPKGRLALGGSLVGVIVLGYLMMQIASQPSYTTMLTGLDPALTGQGSNLQPGAVRGIAQLVSGSVKGLALNNVSITDSTGALLWPNSEAGASDGQMASTMKQAAEARYDQQVESNLNAMLVQTLGPGKAQVQVNSDLNMNQASQDQLQYDKKGVPLQQQTQQETLKGGGAGGGGAA